MFTGLLPSAHGAHFRTMAYTASAPTLAETLAAAGVETEVVTRNSIFDGTLPGITRGFRHNTPVLAPRRLNPLGLVLALSKPRFRRQVQTTGFFHPAQRARRDFVTTFARATIPADRLALAHVLARLTAHRRRGRPCFLFANLYDVHAPYPPTPTSLFRPWRSLAGCLENLHMPFVLPVLGGHAYLRPGFRLSARSRRMLRARYHRAIALMDATLAAFHRDAARLGLLDDTCLVVTSDHGEAFGEHGLYLHDASVYETHLHVPLFVHHPGRPPAVVDDVVSLAGLHRLIRAVALGEGLGETILSADHRARHPIALAEHVHYPHAPDMAPEYRQDLLAAVAGTEKVILRREGVVRYDLARDPDETDPQPGRLEEFVTACARAGTSRAALARVQPVLERWQETHEGTRRRPADRARPPVTAPQPA
jgi:hypothetical protein